MSIDYNLQINTQKTPKEISDLILQMNNFQKNEKENSFFADGLVGSVGYEEKHSQVLTQQDFGFIPNVYVWFSPFRGEMEEKGMQSMMKAIMTVLQHDSGDAVVLMNGDYIVLTRIEGNLTLNSQSFGKKEEREWSLEEISISKYEVKELELAAE